MWLAGDQQLQKAIILPSLDICVGFWWISPRCLSPFIDYRGSLYNQPSLDTEVTWVTTVIYDKSTWYCAYVYICSTENLKSTENVNWGDMVWHRGFIDSTDNFLSTVAYHKCVQLLQPGTLPPKAEGNPSTTYASLHVSDSCFICCVMQRICKCVRTLPVMPWTLAKLLFDRSTFQNVTVSHSQGSLLKCWLLLQIGNQLHRTLR